MNNRFEQIDNGLMLDYETGAIFPARKELDMVYLQQSKFDKNSFAEVDNASKATHFIDENGAVSELTTQVQKKTKPAEEPLELPALNFGKEQKQTDNDDILDLPSTAPRHTESQEDIKSHKVGEYDEEPLELPSLV